MTLELKTNSKLEVEYVLLPNNVAEIKIPGLGYIHVDGEDFVLHPVTPICSERLAVNMIRSPRASVALLRAVEDLATKIFPNQQPWLWSIHDSKRSLQTN